MTPDQWEEWRAHVDSLPYSFWIQISDQLVAAIDIELTANRAIVQAAREYVEAIEALDRTRSPEMVGSGFDSRASRIVAFKHRNRTLKALLAAVGGAADAT